jgi:hypothetical protein
MRLLSRAEKPGCDIIGECVWRKHYRPSFYSSLTPKTGGNARVLPFAPNLVKAVLIFILIDCLLASVFPLRACAQLSIPGKVMTYRTVDLDSREELERTRSWQVSDGRSASELRITTYPVGTQVLSQCVFANGFAHPATTFRSIMLSMTGELERSDFDTFNPKYYPFLAAPVAADMQPGTCVSRGALNLARLVSGGEIATWIWSDSGLIGANFRPEENEKLTVAAGSFDALRVRVDLDLSKLFPHVPALFLSLVKPQLTIWIARAEPYYVLKMVGFGGSTNKLHKNTAIELASISEMTPNDSMIAPALAQADAIGTQPHLIAVNSGSWTQGDRAGHVTLATASTPAGELLVTHVAFSNGLATESRALIERGAIPPTVYLDDRSFATNGAIVRKHVLFFRKAAFPDDPKKDLPADLYGADGTLGVLLPRLLPEGTDDARFHVMDFSGQVNELTIHREGTTAVALGVDDAPAIHAKLEPIVDIPVLLRPLAYFFTPSFDAYFDADSPHRVLKFVGPLGPPGVPNATMLADEKVSAFEAGLSSTARVDRFGAE